MLIDQQTSLNKTDQLLKFSRRKQASEIDINCLNHYKNNLICNDLLNMTEKIDCSNKSPIQKTSPKSFDQDEMPTKNIHNSVDIPPVTTICKNSDNANSHKPDPLSTPETCYKLTSPCLSTPPRLNKPNFIHYPYIPEPPKSSKENPHSINNPKFNAYPGELSNHHFPPQPPIYYYGHPPVPIIQPFRPITNCSMTKNHGRESSSHWALNPSAQSQYMCDPLMIPAFHGMVNSIDHTNPRSVELSRSGAAASTALPRRKNATRETTSALKAWLVDHRKNPYPTKGEKIMLAIITKMTLTQVSTWFANARRRLKKESKFTNASAGPNRLDDLDDDLDDDIVGADDGSSFEQCSSDEVLSPNLTSHSTPVKFAPEKNHSVSLGTTTYGPGSDHEPSLAFYSPYAVGYGAQPPQNALMFDPVLAAAASYYYGCPQPQNLPEFYHNRGKSNFPTYPAMPTNCRLSESESKSSKLALSFPRLKRSSNSDSDILDESKFKKQRVTSKSPDEQPPITDSCPKNSSSSPTMPNSNIAKTTHSHTFRREEEHSNSQDCENTFGNISPKSITPPEKVKPGKIWSMVDIVSSDAKIKLDPRPPHSNEDGGVTTVHYPHPFQPLTPALTYLNPYHHHPFFYPGLQNPYENVPPPWNYLMYPPRQPISGNANMAKISQQTIITHNDGNNVTQVTNGPDACSP